MESEKIRNLVIDNDIEWVKKLTIIINQEDDMVVVGASLINNDVCSLVRMMNPQIILIDVFPKKTNWEGAELIRSIQEVSNAKIIIFTLAQNPELVKSTLFAGAKEYIIKENYKMLPEIIRIITKRCSVAEIMTQTAYEYGQMAAAKRKEDLISMANLTPSERRIFYRLERRLTRVQIAKELDISENTVKNHITNILNKMDVENAKEAVKKINNMV